MTQKFHHHILNAIHVIDGYDGSKPLHHHLKNFYKLHKNMGSRDRKHCSELVYAFYRLGNISNKLSLKEKISLAVFLCSIEGFEYSLNDDEFLINHYTKSLTEKIRLLFNTPWQINLFELFPFSKQLSKQIDIEQFQKSLLIQPRTFIKIGVSQSEELEKMLQSLNVIFKKETQITFSFEPRVNLDNIIPKHINFEIQDFSSQETSAFMNPKDGERWLDCCAASGGKSLLLFDRNKNIKVMATDNRLSIIQNYIERLSKNNITNFETNIWDATNPSNNFKQESFDGIIADVPCSGSGTWGRTPENISFFDISKIEFFHKLQISISRNVIQYLKPGGKMIYITCSVFENENEKVLEALLNDAQLKLLQSAYIKGYHRKSDTMFVAEIKKLEK